MPQQLLNYKAQPMMVFTDRRLECCKCGSLAIAMTMIVDTQGVGHMDSYCQDHFFYNNIPVQAPENNAPVQAPENEQNNEHF